MARKIGVVVGLLCGLLGVLAGFTFGHIHGLHAVCSHTAQRLPTATTTPSPQCAAQEAALRRQFEALAARIDALELQVDAEATTEPLKKCAPCETTSSETTPKTPPQTRTPASNSTETPCEEVAAYASELETQVETLAAALKTNVSTSKTGLGRSGWKNVTPYRRELLWQKVLAGFPYTLGATSSSDALIFDRGGECLEMDVVVAPNRNGVCLAVFDSRLPVYTMLRIDNAKGKLLEAERKKASPKKHKPAPESAYSEEALKKRALILPQVEPMPKMLALKEALKATASFAREAPRLVAAVKDVILKKRIGARAKTVVVMATNLGTLDLVANFACSVRALDEDKSSTLLQSVLVFAADEYSATAVAELGVASFYDKSLGELPAAAAQTYGDFNFVRMMWLKVTSVYLVATARFNVLFQDADVVWLRDPLPYFHSADPEVDAFFMDDGARSQRYTPFYANTGFYFLRTNDRVLYFVHRLLMGYDNILTVRSHQHALIMLLLEHVSKYGLTVNVLDKELFPQGQIFHHKKHTMQRIVDRQIPANVFHMCWTAGRTDKLAYMKNMGLWFLTPTCTLEAFQDNADAFSRPPRGSRRPAHNVSSCCLRGLRAFDAPTPYTKAITIRSKK